MGTHGIPIVTCGDDVGTVRGGVMAQEVMATHPEAVITHPLGFLMVDYSKLGFENAAV
jgi:hypothetical protein